MCEKGESKKADSSSGGVRQPRQGAAATTQCVFLLSFAVTVLVALFYDSRLYYGIDVDGHPIHEESPVRRPELLDLSPVSTNAATGTQIDIEDV